MKEILTKISSYDLFNNLIPGTLFAVLADKFIGIDLLQENVFLGIVLYYFFGMVISRFGSLVIKPLLQLLGVVKEEPYAQYVKASKKDDKLEVLSQVNNTYRTIVALIFCLLLAGIYVWLEECWAWIKDYRLPLLSVGLLILFIVAFRKQTRYIAERVTAINSRE